MRLAIIAATLIGLAAPAVAQQDYTITNLGGTYRITESDGTQTIYRKFGDSYIVSRSNSDGHYLLMPNGNGYHVSNSGAQWGLTFAPPPPPPGQ